MSPSRVLSFYDLTREQALQFRDHVAAREPYRLGVLAERMVATGGPIEAMDASVASLVPVWRWFMGFATAGFPGIPVSHAPTLAPELFGPGLSDARERVRRHVVATEGLAHYVGLVLRHADPQARWDVYLQSGRILEADHQETMVCLSDDAFLNVLTFVPGAVQTYFDPPEMVPTARSEGRLLDLVVMRRPGLEQLEQERQASVLEDYLPYARAPLPPEVATSPLTLWAAQPLAPMAKPKRKPDRGQWFGAELTLAVGPSAGLADLTLLRPLPPGEVAQVMVDLDLTHADGTAATPEDLLTHGTQLFADDGTAMVETAVADGALRALYMEPAGGGTAAHWRRIERRLQKLARHLGGHMVAVGPQDWPEP